MTHEDNHSLLAWLRGKELDALNIQANSKTWEMERYWGSRAVAFREVINHIESNPKELHRCLIPAGREEV
jgi:hypothetical protein